MTRTYDSGLTKPLPTLLREGIITKLAPTLRSNGAYAVAIVPFPYVMTGGELRAEHDLDVLIRLVGNRCPAYAVGVGDIRGKRAGSAGSYIGEVEVEVYCITNHMRHIVEGRLAADPPASAGTVPADKLDPGVEVMREFCRMFLSDCVPVVGGTAQAGNPYSVYGTKIKELNYEGERELITTPEHTVWGVRFSCTIELETNMLRGAVQLLTEIMSKHRIGAYDPPNPATPPLIQSLTDVP